MYDFNLHPLNQVAKYWLEQAKAERYDHQPYLLQLIWWGLEESGMGLTPASLWEIKEKLLPHVYSFLMSEDKEAVNQYLIRGHDPNGDQHLSVETLKNAQSPEDAAWRAVDSLSDLIGADPDRDRSYLLE